MGPVQKQRWIYASSKQLLERIIYAHGLKGDLDYSIIRPFNFVGPRFDYLVPSGAKGGPRVFSHFMSAMFTGGPIYLVDGGGQHRCFTHIKDASEAFTAILGALCSGSGSETPHTLTMRWTTPEATLRHYRSSSTWRSSATALLAVRDPRNSALDKHAREGNPLGVEHALGRLAPRSGHAGGEHEPVTSAQARRRRLEKDKRRRGDQRRRHDRGRRPAGSTGTCCSSSPSPGSRGYSS